MKKFTKIDVLRIIKRDLSKCPRLKESRIPYEYATPDHIIMTISTRLEAVLGKTRHTRNYTFGGPHYTAILNFNDPQKLEVNFFMPTKGPYKIPYGRICRIEVVHLIA